MERQWASVAERAGPGCRGNAEVNFGESVTSGDDESRSGSETARVPRRPTFALWIRHTRPYGIWRRMSLAQLRLADYALEVSTHITLTQSSRDN